jgi:hypothetical protein
MDRVTGSVDQLEELRRRIIDELRQLPLPELGSPKSVNRSLHLPAVQAQLAQSQDWARRKYPKYADYFANGSEIRPEAIRPVLVEVTASWHALARLTWSLPFTKGYGRRLRFLVIDEENNKLMGILGLQSPPLDFPARDRLFNYALGRKVELVSQTMDIYTLGALPPYSRLLGGKLVALASVADELRVAYARKYGGRTTELRQSNLPGELVALTTTSAFGRSSLYNRLRFRGRLIAQSIGYTEGYGSFHLATLYPLLREFLERQGVSTRGGFGVGPRIVWQTCIRALDRLGLPRNLLRHGLRREVFLFPLASNLESFMNGSESVPTHYEQGFTELAAWWRQRWLLPRAERVDGWHVWSSAEIERMILTSMDTQQSEVRHAI